jgi:hypothetical protein
MNKASPHSLRFADERNEECSFIFAATGAFTLKGLIANVPASKTWPLTTRIPSQASERFQPEL